MSTRFDANGNALYRISTMSGSRHVGAEEYSRIMAKEFAIDDATHHERRDWGLSDLAEYLQWGDDYFIARKRNRRR